LAGGIDGLPKVWVPDRAFSNDVNGSTEECLQRFGESEVTIGKARHLSVSEGRHKIEIACPRVKSTTCSRAEEVEAPRAKLATKVSDCIALLCNTFDHLAVAFSNDLGIQRGVSLPGPFYRVERLRQPLFMTDLAVTACSEGTLPTKESDAGGKP
jgi:hypothetical protein